SPDKVITDGLDSDTLLNGEILSISPGFSDGEKLTFVIEKDGYIKRCDDNNGAGYTFSIANDASTCSNPTEHNTINCFFEYIKFNVVIRVIKRNDDKAIGILTVDSVSQAVSNINNSKVFGVEADTGTGVFVTADGDVTENRARFCSDNNDNNPVNNIGFDCSATQFIFIPVLTTTKKFSLMIAGYARKEVDLSTNNNLGIMQINLVFSDNSADCSGVSCVSALETSVIIDKIEDELGNTIGIGSGGTIGSISKSDSTLNLSNSGDSNTTFSDLNTQFNGIPYIVNNKWYTPSLANLSNNSFKLLIAGFEQKDSGVLDSGEFSATNPQKTIRFVKNTTDINICPTGSVTIKCLNAFKFASLIRINNIEGSLKPTDLNLTLNSSNTFLKVVKNGVTLGPSNFNGPATGVFSICPGETSGTNCLYLSVQDYLGQNQNMTVELTIDGFTKGTYYFNPTTLFTQQEPASSEDIFFALKTEKVKDEIDKYFNVGGTCNVGADCNNSNITTTLSTIITTRTEGPAGSFSIIKSYSMGGKFLIALSGTKTISEQEGSPPTIKGKLSMRISGFVGSNSQFIEIPNISLSNTAQKELKFGFDSTNTTECPQNSSIIYCSGEKFKYKLIVRKLMAQDNVNPSNLQDVTSQMANLDGRVSSSNGAEINGILRSANLLYIGIYDTTINQDGTNRNTVETVILGDPDVQFTLNNTTSTYEKLNIVIAQIFFDANVSTQFFLEVAPTTQCSIATNRICSNSFFTMRVLSIKNISIISPPDGKGLGGTTFKLKFTFEDKNGRFPDSVDFTLDTDLDLNISSGDLIKNKNCSLTEEDSGDRDTTNGKGYFCEVVLTFVSDGTNRGFNKGRFILKAVVGNFSTTALSPLNQVITVLDSPPTLSDNSVNPASGPVGTTFEFRVLYKDKEGHPPSFIELVADFNGNNIIDTNEIFRMRKVNINDNDFIIFGVWYTTSVKVSQAPTGNIIRYGFRAGDGFVNENGSAIVSLLPGGLNLQDISSGAHFTLTLNINRSEPEIEWAGIPGFEQEKFGLGFVEPDIGRSGDNFTFLVVYKSLDNIPAVSVKV
ncbi:MAG: hypothetical protein ACK4NF_05595, partial [Planctomycetota bacterium]